MNISNLEESLRKGMRQTFVENVMTYQEDSRSIYENNLLEGFPIISTSNPRVLDLNVMTTLVKTLAVDQNTGKLYRVNYEYNPPVVDEITPRNGSDLVFNHVLFRPVFDIVKLGDRKHTIEARLGFQAKVVLSSSRTGQEEVFLSQANMPEMTFRVSVGNKFDKLSGNMQVETTFKTLQETITDTNQFEFNKDTNEHDMYNVLMEQFYASVMIKGLLFLSDVPLNEIVGYSGG